MLFQAGSVSKPMFALTLLRYVDKGLIDLDADISGIVPEFVRKGPLTFPALLSHTAGYNLHGFPGYRADHEPLSLEDVLNGKGVTPKLRRIRPYGRQHMYSGGGITLAELAFTRITGTTLREAFRKEVAEPLGLPGPRSARPSGRRLPSLWAFSAPAFSSRWMRSSLSTPRSASDWRSRKTLPTDITIIPSTPLPACGRRPQSLSGSALPFPGAIVGAVSSKRRPHGA